MARRKRLLWQLFPTYLFIVFLSLLSVTWYAISAFQDFYLDLTSKDLKVRSIFLEKTISDLVITKDYKKIDEICKDMGHQVSTYFTVILPSGKVICDTQRDPNQMNNHQKRPEILKTKKETSGMAIRFSTTRLTQMMYVAIPMIKAGKLHAFIRSGRSIQFIRNALDSILIKIILAGLAIAVFAALISLYISKRISQPLVEMKNAAMKFAEEDWSHHIAIPNSEEIGSLAIVLNETATQLRARINTITQQKTEHETVLSSMVEGVVAIDTQQRIISTNKAANQLFLINGEKAKGRFLQEEIRNTDLIQFVENITQANDEQETEIVLSRQREKILKLHGTILRDAHGKNIGILVVFHDVTKVRHLEEIRQEFVANVSHELKTPITLIKGFVETVLDGEIHNPENAEHFLKIALKHVNRLNNIIEDLLVLAKVESDEKNTMLEFASIPAVIQSAVQFCETKAGQKNIIIQVDLEDDLSCKINAPLIEQAMINLIDNAIKYSEENTVIKVKASKKADNINLSVKDQGSGIMQEHLPRLFERFYRIDKSRSRKVGGTGLGLSIVKHIAQAHEGTVSVESIVQKGSEFSIHLPI
ncbi:MAG: two-component system phosphate regulon sensor histidine kinase PhoR [bacterium]|jgi:two-component system phosphate regulon sensor histidine kinase PhoR